MSVLQETTYSESIGSKYIVWFQNSNRWVLFEEPAFFVFKRLKENQSADKISKECRDRYHLSEDESADFTGEIISGIEAHQSAIPHLPSIEPNYIDELTVQEFPINETYFINEQVIGISYASESLAYYIHPLLQQFVSDPELATVARFKVFNTKDDIILLKEGEAQEAWSYKNILHLKKQLFIEICGLIYNKDRSDWLTFIHGSGISNGKEAMILAATSGSGKSTMAALFMKQGYQVMSDDFIPVERSSGIGYPFPAAISVKKVALAMLSELYPGLEKSSYAYKEFETEWVNLLPLSTLSFKPYPVMKIVFLSYQPDDLQTFELISQEEAFQFIIDNAVIPAGMNNISSFVKWLKSITCYKLSYPDATIALIKLEEIFLNQ